MNWNHGRQCDFYFHADREREKKNLFLEREREREGMCFFCEVCC